MVVSLGVGVVCVLGLGVVRFCVEGRAGEVAAVLLLLTVDDGKTVLLVEVLDWDVIPDTGIWVVDGVVLTAALDAAVNTGVETDVFAEGCWVIEVLETLVLLFIVVLVGTPAVTTFGVEDAVVGGGLGVGAGFRVGFRVGGIGRVGFRVGGRVGFRVGGRVGGRRRVGGVSGVEGVEGVDGVERVLLIVVKWSQSYSRRSSTAMSLL